MNTEKIYIGALNKWGAENQIKKCLEEYSELMVALCQCSDGRDNVRHVAEEIANVQIMLNQMVILFDCDTLEEFTAIWKAKERESDGVFYLPLDKVEVLEVKQEEVRRNE